jgi:hypothetical protein
MNDILLVVLQELDKVFRNTNWAIEIINCR